MKTNTTEIRTIVDLAFAAKRLENQIANVETWLCRLRAEFNEVNRMAELVLDITRNAEVEKEES